MTKSIDYRLDRLPVAVFVCPFYFVPVSVSVAVPSLLVRLCLDVAMFGRKNPAAAQPVDKDTSAAADTPPSEAPRDDAHATTAPTTAQIKRATRTRLTTALLTSFLFLVAVVFLILVELGDTYSSRPALTRINFINIDLSEVIPSSVPNAAIVNSIAQTIGLHDFYTVGLWGFCEGYHDRGVTFCSKPKTLYWFNPVEIILNELLAGATSES